MSSAQEQLDVRRRIFELTRSASPTKTRCGKVKKSDLSRKSIQKLNSMILLPAACYILPAFLRFEPSFNSCGSIFTAILA